MAFSLTNDHLNKLLRSLGFEPGEMTAKSHRHWRHPQSGCSLQLPANKLDHPPRPADLVGIQVQLDLQGHLDAAAFELFMSDGRLPTAAVAE